MLICAVGMSLLLTGQVQGGGLALPGILVRRRLPFGSFIPEAGARLWEALPWGSRPCGPGLGSRIRFGVGLGPASRVPFPGPLLPPPPNCGFGHLSAFKQSFSLEPGDPTSESCRRDRGYSVLNPMWFFGCWPERHAQCVADLGVQLPGTCGLRGAPTQTVA